MSAGCCRGTVSETFGLFIGASAYPGDFAPGYAGVRAEGFEQVADGAGRDTTGVCLHGDLRFPGPQQLIEPADQVEVLQAETVCWCGARVTHHARGVVSGGN